MPSRALFAQQSSDYPHQKIAIAIHFGSHARGNHHGGIHLFDHRRAFNARACAEQIPLEDRSLNEATAFVEVELTLFLQSIAEAVRTRQFLESECCACLSTPNGLRTLSVKSNLTSNPLTGVVPNNVVIKLIATTPVGSPCDPSRPPSPRLRAATWHQGCARGELHLPRCSQPVHTGPWRRSSLFRPCVCRNCKKSLRDALLYLRKAVAKVSVLAGPGTNL